MSIYLLSLHGAGGSLLNIVHSFLPKESLCATREVPYILLLCLHVHVLIIMIDSMYMIIMIYDKPCLV